MHGDRPPSLRAHLAVERMRRTQVLPNHNVETVNTLGQKMLT